MAGQDQGRREPINDPLAITGREQRPDRSIALQGVRAPNVGDPTGAFGRQVDGLSTAMSGLQNAVSGVIEQKKEELIVAGKTAYLTGVTEEEIKAKGDRYTTQGYLHLQARDKVNNWFTSEAINIEEAGKKMNPTEYQAFLGQKRKEILDTITDPNARKVAVAAFEELSPKLGQSQFAKNNAYNKEQKVQAFSTSLAGSAKTSADAPVRGDGPLKLTPAPIAPVILSGAEERDVAIRTMLGEAQNQGTAGMAAVAHVLRNRATSAGGAWPKSIKGVALQDKQFSVWNNGGGGWYGRTENPLYKKAGEIYDAVISGRHVDPTGGATHYYSPAGMKAQGGPDKPTWFDAEASKAGGVVTIGGHVFAGRAEGFSGEGKLNFLKEGADKLQPAFTSILTDASAAVGRALTINSGYRSEDHPAERNKATGPGQHTNGNAADIDMTGMDDKQRQQLVRELRARGVLRFGTYSNSPNMLHVDMKDQNGDGASWFMHDRTNQKFDSAPAWIKAAASEPPGSIPATPPQSGTNMQNYVRGFSGLDGPTKAKAVADALRRELDAGDSTLFDSLGGVAALRDLQAQPSDVDEVIKAHTRYKQKKSNEFSVARSTFKDEILRRAEKGESRDVIFADIEKARKKGDLDDIHANSLASEAASKIRSADTNGSKTVLDNVEFMQEIGGLYQKIKTGGWDKGEIAKEGTALAKRYGATDTDVKQIVGKMFQLDQGYQDGLRRSAEATIATAQKQAIVKKNVADVIANGVGLEHITGERIKITNKFGNETTVSPKEYGVIQIKEKHSKDVADGVAAGKIDPAAAKGELLRRTYTELQRHNVIDHELNAELKGHLSGNIIQKDGTISPDAMKAYEAYGVLKQTPNINDGYVSKTVEDSYVRSLLETAWALDQGDLSPEQALRKAHEIVNDPLRDPADRIKKDAIWTTELNTEVDKAIREKVAPEFWRGLVYDDSRADADRVIKDNKGTIMKYVQNRADLYHLQHPNEDPKVSRKKALDDFQANATYVAGNVIITEPGFELHKKMGIAGLGRNAADAAIKDFLATAGPSLWPTKWGNNTAGVFGTVRSGESYVGSAVRGMTEGKQNSFFNPFPLLPSVAPRDAPVKITYNAQLGTLTFDLYADKERTKTLGATKVYDAATIGKWYAKKATQPSTVDKVFDRIFEAPSSLSRAAATVDVQNTGNDTIPNVP
jgi:spore germination cell wall hydrolase CwlJ-like protein